MTPQETEKIKLMQLVKQGKIDTLPDVDTAYMTKQMMDKEKNMEEADLGMLNRIDSLVSQRLLIRFLDMFTEIYDDLVVGGDPFEPQDVIEYLSRQMQQRAMDSNMDADGFRSFEEEANVEEGWDMDEASDYAKRRAAERDYQPAKKDAPAKKFKEPKNDYFARRKAEMQEGDVDEAMMPRPSLFRGTDVEKQEYYASLKRDYDRDKEEFKRNYMDYTDEDWVEDFENYVADRQLDEGVEWFKKIAGLGK